ncbi:MAG: glycosyltransferase [Muribaculaceae bacterium]|nr:glycosyltransferase [Muribaculaceae bacterium]
MSAATNPRPQDVDQVHRNGDGIHRDSSGEPLPLMATVILLCYRQQSTIRRALESVLRQECRYRYEILVADDASPDATRAICEEYAAMYPDIVRMLPPAPNKGLIDNYFDAVLAARGKYVSDCAGDDEWADPHRLERCIEILEDNPAISVAFTSTETICEGISSPGHDSPGIPAGCAITGRDVLHKVLDHTDSIPYVLSAALYRRAPVAEALLSTPEILRCHDGGVEDIPLIAFLASIGDAMKVDMTGYRYYIEGESISNNLPHEKDYWFTARVSSMTYRLGRHYGLPVRAQLNHFKTKFSYMAAQARQSGNRALIADMLRRRRQWGLPLPVKAVAHVLLSLVGYHRHLRPKK